MLGGDERRETRERISVCLFRERKKRDSQSVSVFRLLATKTNIIEKETLAVFCVQAVASHAQKEVRDGMIFISNQRRKPVHLNLETEFSVSKLRRTGFRL